MHTDALGSPVAESDETGVIVARYEYEPYGVAIGEGVKDGPAYTGHVADSATGLTYMQQRYYDPELGAFVSVDPVSAYSSPLEQFNRYRYANDDPYGFTDPDGRRAQEGAGRRNDPASMGPDRLWLARKWRRPRVQMAEAVCLRRLAFRVPV